MTALIVPPVNVQPHTAVTATPNWGLNVAIAQQAGDLAYAFAVRAGAPLYQRAIAYHVAFAEKMHELGTPMPCPCDLCTGGEA